MAGTIYGVCILCAALSTEDHFGVVMGIAIVPDALLLLFPRLTTVPVHVILFFIFHFMPSFFYFPFLFRSPCAFCFSFIFNRPLSVSSLSFFDAYIVNDITHTIILQGYFS